MSWHKEAIVYQIYTRSFCDSNGDGIGDLRGIISKLDYIQSLGITAVWLNPIFQSPNEDGGYDISDYYAINPEFGTMDDFDELLKSLHQRNIKLIMDLVLNHSSDQHEWFQQAKKSKDNPYRNFYFWKEGKENNPPNDWPSFFGGSAWQWDDATREYYLHLFSAKQPDLNWENPALRAELKKIMTFWIEKGVDGLRLDVITAISKRTDFPNTDTNDFNETIRRFYTNGPRLKEFIKEIRHDVLEPHQTVSVGEGPGITPENAIDYLDEKDGLSMIFHFGHMFMDQGAGGRFDPKAWTLQDFKKIFQVWDETFERQGWGSVFLGNHDFARMVSRWGNDTEYWEKSSTLLITLLLTARGTPFIFQGDELGMTNIKLHSVSESRDIETITGWSVASAAGVSEQDFLAKANYAGRDNARTPMQWNKNRQAGFSSAQPWMKINPNYQQINVAAQQVEEKSILNFFRKLIQFRKKHPVFTQGKFKIEEYPSPLFIFTRTMDHTEMKIVLNFSSETIQLPHEFHSSKVCFSNYEDTQLAVLRPWEAVIVSS